MTPDLEVSRDIAASPEAVFAALTDIAAMGNRSPECHTNTWNDGHSQAAVGAVFTGQNSNGDKEWTTEAIIVELQENESFVFDCRVGDFVFATWGYRIEAADGGCRVTEQWQDKRPDSVKEMSMEISGVEDRAAHNQAGMAETLAQLAAEVE